MLTDKEMEGKSAEDQAAEAIGYVLRRIRDNAELYHLMGLGSTGYGLLTEAAASLFGEPLEKVRESFICQRDREVAEDE